MAVNIALPGAREVGAQTRLLELKESPLVFCAGKADESLYPAAGFRLRREGSHAQGSSLGTPAYHGSGSGGLKHALELRGCQEIEGQLMGVVGVSGGALRAGKALNSLRPGGRARHAWVVPEQGAMPAAWKAFDAAGPLQASAWEQREKAVGRPVARVAWLHTAAHAQEVLRAWEGAPVNPGGSTE